MAVKDFPKTWPPFILRRFESFEKAYEAIRDLVKGIEDFRKKVLEVDSTKGQPGFSAYLGSTQTLTAVSTYTTIEIDTEQWDSDKAFDTTTFKFTPKVPGKYFFTGFIQWSTPAADTRFGARILKNGTDQMQGEVGSPSVALGHQFGVLGIMEADGIDDFFELQVWQSDSTSETIVSGFQNTRFQAFRIGP